jgi:hypothetical protein
MKNQNIRYRKIIPAVIIAFGLGCFAFLPAAQARDPSIVGLWHTHYFGDLVFESFEQFHSDGQEFEGANVYPGAFCQGTFKTSANGTVELFHTGWLFDASGNLIGFFNEKQILKVGPGGDHYSGTWHERDFDVNGNFLSEENGTVRATRLTVH